MPEVAPLIRLLPLIVRLFPELVKKPTFYRGAVGLLSKTDPEPEENLERALKSKTRIQKRKDFNDDTAVIKVSDAIKCVEKNFNDTSLLKEFVLAGVTQLFRDITGDSKPLLTAAQKLADRMAECIREDSLRQNTPRKYGTKIGPHRPARGHGKGRR